MSSEQKDQFSNSRHVVSKKKYCDPKILKTGWQKSSWATHSLYNLHYITFTYTSSRITLHSHTLHSHYITSSRITLHSHTHQVAPIPLVPVKARLLRLPAIWSILQNINIKCPMNIFMLKWKLAYFLFNLWEKMFLLFFFTNLSLLLLLLLLISLLLQKRYHYY